LIKSKNFSVTALKTGGLPMKYVLQNRWKIEGSQLIYYGIRKKPNLNKNIIKLTKKEMMFFGDFTKGKFDIQNKIFKKFLEQKVIVPESEFIATPRVLNEAVFCQACIANNYLVSLTTILFRELNLMRRGFAHCAPILRKTSFLFCRSRILLSKPGAKKGVLILPYFTQAARIRHTCFIIYPGIWD